MNGIDCLGLVSEYLKAFNIVLPEPEYTEHWSKNEKDTFNDWLDEFADKFEKVSTGKKGDIVLFNNVDNVATHAGIMINDFKFIHAMRKCGVCISNIKQYEHKVKGFYKIRQND
jgi:cell wall-associated NlpC family hydrolase